MINFRTFKFHHNVRLLIFIQRRRRKDCYLMLKADSYDEAVGIAKGCPILEFEDGIVEVREIQE